MAKKFLQFALLSVIFSTAALFAQSEAPPSAPPSRQEPCWRQAGISQSVMEQRHGIERDTHSQVAAVCENSSLTPQQKQQQAREVREQGQQKMDALVTPQQLSTLHACQQQRGTYHPNNGGHPGGPGPCGNFAASQGRQGPSNGNSGGAPEQPQN
jgi:Spy/CpxP family protein refolding chaperone